VIAASAPRALLLDTCAAIWLANGDRLSERALAAITLAVNANGAFVSPISAWEVGLLSRPSPRRPVALQFLPDPKTWFADLIAGPGIKAAPLTPQIAIDASCLPGDLHGDPGDRLLISTARHLGVPIVTRDRAIIGYADAGHVAAIVC